MPDEGIPRPSIPAEPPSLAPLARAGGLWGRLAGLSTAEVVAGMVVAFGVLIVVLGVLIFAGVLLYWLLSHKSEDKSTQLPPPDNPLPALRPREQPVIGDGTALRPVLFGQAGRSPIMFLAYSPDGNYLASRSGTAEVKLWNTTTGAAQMLQPEPGPGAALDPSPSYARPLAFSDDSLLLAWRRDFGFGQPKVRTWLLAENREGDTWDCMGAGATQLAFAPGTQDLITSDDRTGAVRVHKFKKGKEGYDLKRSLGVPGIQGLLSPNGGRLLSLDARPQGAALPGQPPTPPYTYLELYDPNRLLPQKPPFEQQMVMTRIIRLEELTESRQYWGMLFSPGGTRLATWRDQGGVVVSDQDGGDRRHLAGVGPPFAFSVDGNTLAVPGAGGWPRLITIDGGREIGKVISPDGAAGAGKPPVEVRCAAFSPKGRELAIGCTDGSIRVCRWQLQ